MEKICYICIEQINLENKTIILPCFHEFHPKCLFTWKQSRCPLCRANYEFESFLTKNPETIKDKCENIELYLMFLNSRIQHSTILIELYNEILEDIKSETKQYDNILLQLSFLLMMTKQPLHFFFTQ